MTTDLERILDVMAVRVINVINEARKAKDPRYFELVKVLQAGQKSYTRKGRLYHGGHSAVFMHLEENYPDLYGRIQTSNPHLNKNIF